MAKKGFAEYLEHCFFYHFPKAAFQYFCIYRESYYGWPNGYISTCYAKRSIIKRCSVYVGEVYTFSIKVSRLINTILNISEIN